MFLTDLMLSCSRWFFPYDQFFLFSVQQQQTAVSQYTDEIIQTVFQWWYHSPQGREGSAQLLCKNNSLMPYCYVTP